MPRKKKSDVGYIRDLDILQSGVNTKDPTEDMDKNDNGAVIIRRNKSSRESSALIDAEQILLKEKEIAELKKRIEENTNKDIKELKKKAKKEKKKDKKKDKKSKKKNKKDTDEFLSLLASNGSDKDLTEIIDAGGKKGLKKKKKKEEKAKKKKEKMREELGINVKEKRGRRKGQTTSKKTEKEDKNKSEVAKSFRECERITKETLADIDATMKILDTRVKELTNSNERIRGKDTALANYITAKTSLISTKQKAATDILSARAKVYDIEMKKAKQGSGEQQSSEQLIAKLFPAIAFNPKMAESIDQYVDNNDAPKKGKKKDKKKGKKKNKGYEEIDYEDMYSDDALAKREKELVKSGEIEYSPLEKNIEYEGTFNVAIKRSWQTGEWKFVATDNNNKIIKVPKGVLPSKKACDMKFDDEKDVAVDKNTKTMYKIFPVAVL